MTVALTGVARIFELSAANTLNILRSLTLTNYQGACMLLVAKTFSGSYRVLMEHGIVWLPGILDSELSKPG